MQNRLPNMTLGIWFYNLDADVLPLFTEIMYYAQQREYFRANDAHYKLSIENAAWPIGVVAVGIHERSSADKIQYAPMYLMMSLRGNGFRG